MAQGRIAIRCINVIFGILFGLLMFRLALGPHYDYPALYTHIVWVLLYPISILRDYSNLSIYVLFYTIFWLYVFMVKIVVLEAPFRKTLLRTLIWMLVMALPFLPFGIEYFSLAIYMTTISSYLLRLLPFIALLAALFLANRFYFNQSYLFAGAWTLVNFLLVIVVITLSDLLPVIKSQIFFHALGYRLSLANSFVSGSPLFALLIIICLAVFYVFIFENQFLRLPFRKTTLISIVTPIGILIALSFVLMIMRDDFRRYRYFDYQGGIATVYFAKYDDRQILSFDDSKFTLSSSRYSVFYPFGKFDIQDTLRKHADDILRMKVIEGLDYYRLERITTIIAHGARDETIYRQLQRVIDGKRYRLPQGFKPWAEYINRRYRTPSRDIVVTGWIMINERPLESTEFFVNKIAIGNRRAVEPIWQGRTDAHGQFQFTCYRDVEVDQSHFGVIFLLPESLIGRNVDYLKVVHPLSGFSEPGTYVLDTVRIRTEISDREMSFKELSIRTSSPPDSFLLLLPSFDRGTLVRFAGTVSVSGMVDDVTVDPEPQLSDTVMIEEMVERLRGSEFYLRDTVGTFLIEIK
jgi:hypothetical protein